MAAVQEMVLSMTVILTLDLDGDDTWEAGH
jgi:hypothetical protein